MLHQLYNALMATPPRRWFRYSLRTLLIALTLLTMLLGAWANYYVQWRHARREARAWINEHPIRETPRGGLGGGMPDPDRPFPWALALFGEKPEPKYIYIYRQYLDERVGYRNTVEQIRTLFPESYIEDRAHWKEDELSQEELSEQE